MNKNLIRICIGSLLGTVLLTVLMTLLETTILLWVAYAWCVWAILVFAISLGFWSTSNKFNYILYSTYPLVAKSYLVITILVAIIFSSLSYYKIWIISWGWFCFIELIIFSIAIWITQAIDAGKDEILAVEKNIKNDTHNWKLVITNISTIYDKAQIDDKKIIIRILEAIKFADPIGHNEVINIEENIKEKISILNTLVEEKNSEEIKNICIEIEILLKERATKLITIK